MLLRADVTENNDDDKALLQRFKSFGPPTIAFFDRSGVERRQLQARRLRAGREVRGSRAATRRALRSSVMAKSRPVLLTAVLSGPPCSATSPIAHCRLDGPRAPAELSSAKLAAEAERRPPRASRRDACPTSRSATLPASQQSIPSWPGKPLLINFWATWCGPCLREIPMLKELQTARPDVQVVGIAIDKRDPVVEFAGKMQFNYPILIGAERGVGRGGGVRRQHLRPAVHDFHGRRRQHPRRAHGRAARRAPRGVPQRRRRPRATGSIDVDEARSRIAGRI